MSARPETIEQDWERFYSEFPDVYDRFAVTSPRAIAAIDKLFGLGGKLVVDVGSGTGRSTLALAKKARLVIGVEPWASMREFAMRKAARLAVMNVAFVEGLAQALPLRDRSVDLAVAILGVPLGLHDEHGELIADRFARDAARAVRPGGYVVSVEGPPGSRNRWRPRRERNVEIDRMAIALEGVHGFRYHDVYVRQGYASVKEAVETYGFIYGSRAIEHLKQRQQRSFRMRLRLRYKRID